MGRGSLGHGWLLHNGAFSQRTQLLEARLLTIPHTLHPAPYTLHPTPYTLRTTPCIAGVRGVEAAQLVPRGQGGHARQQEAGCEPPFECCIRGKGRSSPNLSKSLQPPLSQHGGCARHFSLSLFLSLSLSLSFSLKKKQDASPSLTSQRILGDWCGTKKLRISVNRASFTHPLNPNPKS